MWAPVHLAGALALFYWNSSVLNSFLVGYVLVSGLGIAVGYHRFYSHRSFKTTKLTQVLLTWCGVLGCQGKPIYWASIHRTIHHPHADTALDLHTPSKGWWHAYMGWMFKIDPSTAKLKGVGDLVRDPIIVWFHRNYYLVLWGTWIIVGILSPHVLLGLALSQAWAFHQENLIDTFCHSRGWWGYRSYDTRDNSMNVPILGYLTWGQGWHNNHHHQAYPYNYGRRWWEIDLGSLLVELVRVRDVLL